MSEKNNHNAGRKRSQSNLQNSESLSNTVNREVHDDGGTNTEGNFPGQWLTRDTIPPKPTQNKDYEQDFSE
jgi:hypothetical protein